MNGFRKLAVTSTATTFALVAVGGLVRATRSGDACPTWPGCFPGRFFPPMETHALIEWAHRTLAGIVVVLIGAMAVWSVRRFRQHRSVWVPSVAAFVAVLLQAGVGALRIFAPESAAAIVTVHIATAMLLIGLLMAATINAFCVARSPDATGTSKELASLASVTAAAMLILVLVGAYVRGLGAGLAFPDWPLMDGRLLPGAGELETPHFVHRLLALVVGLLVLAVVLRAFRQERPDAGVRGFAAAAAALYLAQVLAGAINVWTGLAPAAVVAHVTLSALTWAAIAGLAIVARNVSRGTQTAPADTPATSSARAATERGTVGAGAVARAYVKLMKPRIIVLLLVTTVPAMVVAAGGWPGWALVLATLGGGTLAAGGANAINCYIDRDIDAKMGRTATRPIPAGSVEPARALEFGIGLGILAFGYLWAVVNLLSAALAIAALLFYVFVYTIGLKRSTPQNIVIGGAAGAVPVLVGWSAVTGTLTWAPVVMFLIIFFWTPPHFWALSLRFAKDYQRAGVPMLPVVAGARETHRQIFVYSIVLVVVTLAFHPIGRMGALYLGSALALGAWFIRGAAILRRSGTERAALGLFKYSINYLALLFAAMALDTVVKA